MDNNKTSKELVEIFFNSLPKKEILKYAKNVQKRIQDSDETIIQKKNDGTLATEADTYVEKMIIDCFNRSPLKNLCGIRGEENVGDVVKNGLWTLLIDPIDGTSSLVKGDKTWGTMVGLEDKNGILRYSWNLLSTGEIFESDTTSVLAIKKSLHQIEKPIIDFYDYSSGQKEVFREILLKTRLDDCELTSCPSAVWAGWELYQNKLSALVWIIGENEKKTYPDYDLIFLDVLMRQGYKIRLGKLSSNKNGIVVVAPTDEDAEKLYKIAFDIVSSKSVLPITEIKNRLLL